MFTYTNILITGVIVSIFLVPAFSIIIGALDGLGLSRSNRYEPAIGIGLSLLVAVGIIPALILNYQFTSGSALLFPYADWDLLPLWFYRCCLWILRLYHSHCDEQSCHHL